MFEAKLRESPLEEEWLDRLNEANDKVLSAVKSRDRIQREHRTATKTFENSDKIMRQYINRKQSKIEKCLPYFELRNNSRILLFIVIVYVLKSYTEFIQE